MSFTLRSSDSKKVPFRECARQSSFYDCAVTSLPGNQDEDSFCIYDNEKSNLTGFGVFDGHGGKYGAHLLSSTYCSHVGDIFDEMLKNYSLDNLSAGSDATGKDIVDSFVCHAINKTTKKLDRLIKTEGTSGSSAIAIFAEKLTDGTVSIICSNVGDSRCIVSKSNQLFCMSYDHVLESPPEMERIVNGCKVDWMYLPIPVSAPGVFVIQNDEKSVDPLKKMESVKALVKKVNLKTRNQSESVVLLEKESDPLPTHQNATTELMDQPNIHPEVPMNRCDQDMRGFVNALRSLLVECTLLHCIHRISLWMPTSVNFGDTAVLLICTIDSGTDEISDITVTHRSAIEEAIVKQSFVSLSCVSTLSDLDPHVTFYSLSDEFSYPPPPAQLSTDVRQHDPSSSPLHFLCIPVCDGQSTHPRAFISLACEEQNMRLLDVSSVKVSCQAMSTLLLESDNESGDTDQQTTNRHEMSNHVSNGEFRERFPDPTPTILPAPPLLALTPPFSPLLDATPSLTAPATTLPTHTHSPKPAPTPSLELTFTAPLSPTPAETVTSSLRHDPPPQQTTQASSTFGEIDIAAILSVPINTGDHFHYLWEPDSLSDLSSCEAKCGSHSDESADLVGHSHSRSRSGSHIGSGSGSVGSTVSSTKNSSPNPDDCLGHQVVHAPVQHMQTKKIYVDDSAHDKKKKSEHKAPPLLVFRRSFIAKRYSKKGSLPSAALFSRYNVSISMTRSIGDKYAARACVCIPDISSITIQANEYAR